MSEKVKEIRAKKLAAASASQVFSDSRQLTGGGSLQSSDEGERPVINPTVEAALARVRRAGLAASFDPQAVRASRALKNPVIRDRAATATAIDPVEESLPVPPALIPTPEPDISLSPRRTLASNADRDAEPRQRSAPLSTPIAETTARRTTVTSVSAKSAALIASSQARTTSPLTSPSYAAAPTSKSPAIDINIAGDGSEPIDEIEPLDYLEAEVRKVDSRLLKQEVSERAPYVCRVISGAVDAVTVTLSAAPFVGLIIYSGGNFAAAHTQVSIAAVVVLIMLFYLALTQSLSGRTFGMMVTNTRVVESGTHSSPSVARVLVRSIGYLISIAPGAIGLLWMILDRKDRTWHDLLSGTIVIRDF